MANNFDWSKYPVIPEPSQTGSAAKPSAKFDWSKYPVIAPPTHTGVLAQTAAVPLAALSGIAEGTRQIANLGSAGVNYITRELGIGDVLPHLHKASFTHALHLPQDRPVEAIGETIPALVGADISAPLTGLEAGAKAIPLLTRGMATQAVGGGLYGAGQAASQGQSVVKGGLTGTGIGLAGGAAGEAIGAAGKPIGRFISREIFSPLAQKAYSLIDKDFSPESALSALGKQLKDARSMAKRWGTDLEGGAKEADSIKLPLSHPLTQKIFQSELAKHLADESNESLLKKLILPPGMLHELTKEKIDNFVLPLDKHPSFDNSHYVDVSKNILQNLRKGGKEDPTFYNPLIGAVKDKIKRAPTSFESAVAQRIALNRLPKTWDLTNEAATNLMKSLSGEMGNALDKQVAINSPANDAALRLAKNWHDHRINYAFLKAFDKTPIGQKQGKAILEYSRPQAKAFSGESPSETALQHFLPVGKDKDTLKMEHLGRLMGSPQLARQALKEEYLKPVREGDQDTINPDKLLTRYKKLSSKQQAYFFSPEERTLLDSASKAKGAAKTSAFHHIGARYGTPIGLGAVAGGLVGEHEGEGWGKGALLGAGLGAGLSLVPRAFISPRGAGFAAQLAKKGIPSRGISYPLTSSALSFTQ